MNAQETLNLGTRLSAKELRRLPEAERDAILAAAAGRAEPEYRTSRELTSFEAFGKEDLRGESASSTASATPAGSISM